MEYRTHTYQAFALSSRVAVLKGVYHVFVGLQTKPDEDVIYALTNIRGVGLWTANWLFIRALGRTDGFPHGDLALCRALGLLLNMGTPLSPEEALDYSRRWSPYRSYVTAYMFAAIRSGYVFRPT